MTDSATARFNPHASADASAGPASAPAAFMTPSPVNAAASAHRPLRCFLVEDSPLIRQNLISTLEEMLGVEVLGSAEDEASAVHWVKNHHVLCDILVIDIFLKSGSGLEVLRQAAPLRPTTKLVVLTNYATADMRRRCLQLGADRVFDKSAELEELLAYFEELAALPRLS